MNTCDISPSLLTSLGPVYVPLSLCAEVIPLLGFFPARDKKEAAQRGWEEESGSGYKQHNLTDSKDAFPSTPHGEVSCLSKCSFISHIFVFLKKSVWIPFFSSIAIFEKYSNSSVSICTSDSALRAVPGTGMELHPYSVFFL